MHKLPTILKKKINLVPVFKNGWFWALLAFAFFESPFLNQSILFELVYTGVLVLGAAFVVWHMQPVKSWRSIKVSRVAGCIVAYEVLLVLSSVINGVLSFGILLSATKFVVLILILDTMLRKNFRNCIMVMYNVIEALVWINSLTIFLFPNGIYNIDPTSDKHYYFLGHQNAAGIFLLFAMMLGAVYMRLESDAPTTAMVRGKAIPVMYFRLAALAAVGSAAVLMVWSALSAVGIILLLMLFVYDCVSKKGWTFDPIWAIALNAVVFVVFVVFQRIDLLAWLIKDILHRSLTLSGRTEIWGAAMDAFKENSLFGVGMEQGKTILGFSNAHNRYLNVMFTGGLLAMTVFVVMLLMTRTSVKKHRHNKVMRICSVFLWTVLFMLQVETFDGKYFFLLFLVPCHLARYLDMVALRALPKKRSSRKEV